MYFTKSISTFIVGALLATSALGELTQVPRSSRHDGREIIAARAETAHAMRATTSSEAAMRKRADECIDAIKKRRLSAREDKTVGVGDAKSGKDRDTLSTSSLATCYGVAITGSYEGGKTGDDRFLSHTLEGKREPAEAMFDAVEAARGEGLGNLYALLVYPDPASFTDADDWTDEDRKDVQAEHDWYVEWITDATGGVKPEEKSHSYKEPWGIKINSFKGVQSGRFIG